jgi:uncharacterized protein YecT (DUF1311 family)
MGNIKKIIIIGALVLFSCYSNAQNKSNPNEFVYGKWKYFKHFDWRATKYDINDIKSIKSDTLIIEKNKIFFENTKLIEPCIYSKIMFKSFFDRDDKEPNFVEDRALALKYTKEQLSTFQRIETDCQYNCLNILYLKQDTLILNYCGGITFFFTKLSIDNNSKSEYEKVDKELNQVYQKILQDYKSNTIFIKSMKEAQRQWVKFRDAQLKMKYPAYKNEGESVLPMCRNYYLKELTANRIKELNQWIDEVEEGGVCSGSIKFKGQ